MARISVVTGGNRGIGLEVARGLAERGDDVVLVCRDVDEAARSTAGFPRPVRIERADFTRLDEVRALADRLRQDLPRIDAFVSNAGIWPESCELVEGGFERAFVVNRLAPYLLMRALESTFLASRTRVVVVTAGLAVKGRIALDATPRGADFGPIHTYATTKLCQLALLPSWASRLGTSGASIVAVHPGVVRTGLGDRRGLLGWLLRRVKRGWLDPADGAAAVLALVDADPASNGRYYVERDPADLPPVAGDDGFVRALWEQAAGFVGMPA